MDKEETAPAPEAQEVSEAVEQQTFDAEYVSKLRAEAAKYRTEAKANSEAAARLAEIEDQQKSAEQKATERIASLEAELSTAKAELLRRTVAAEMNLPAALIGRLQGEDEDAMRADAQSLIDGLKEAYVPKTAPTQQDTGAGIAGDGDDLAQLSPDELFARATRG